MLALHRCVEPLELQDRDLVGKGPGTDIRQFGGLSVGGCDPLQRGITHKGDLGSCYRGSPPILPMQNWNNEYEDQDNEQVTHAAAMTNAVPNVAQPISGPPRRRARRCGPGASPASDRYLR